MSPRVSLPGADELFRATSPRQPVTRPPEPPVAAAVTSAPDPTVPPPDDALQAAPSASRAPRTGVRRGRADRGSTGRERHDEKITVYVSAGELVDLEHARLMLRAEHGIAVDRGRIVREALSVLLADLESKREASILVRRLTEGP